MLEEEAVDIVAIVIDMIVQATVGVAEEDIVVVAGPVDMDMAIMTETVVAPEMAGLAVENWTRTFNGILVSYLYSKKLP